MQKANRIIIPLAAITLLVIILGLITQNIFAARLFSKLTGVVLVSDKPYLKIREATIFVDIADSPGEWQLGLSGRKSLAKNEGMLFIFDNEDTRPTFWMEGMLIPLDIIWINDRQIVQMDLEINPPKPDTPSSELELFRPYLGIDYVLEVNGGFVRENSLAVGDKVDFSGLEK